MVVTGRSIKGPGLHSLDFDNLEGARQAIGSRLSILSPEEDVALMQEAGFSDVSLFYAGLSIKGWVGYASASTAAACPGAS